MVEDTGKAMNLFMYQHSWIKFKYVFYPSAWCNKKVIKIDVCARLDLWDSHLQRKVFF